MQKTITLKDFKVFLLKTFLPILVLSISFQVSLGQTGSLTKPSSATKGQPTEKPAIIQQPEGQQRPMFKKVPSGVVAGIAEPTDVPAINKQYAEKIAANPGLNERIVSGTQTPSGLTDVCTFSGSLATTDLTLTNGRFFRSGVPSVCASIKTCGGPFGTGPYYYDTYTFTNQTCSSQCVTVSYIANGTAGDVFSVAYLGSFNPTNLCTNYIADGGSSSLAGGAAVTYNFNLAANATVVIVINGSQVATTCDSYGLTVTGLNCAPPPACTPPTSSILSQVQIAGPPVILLNEQFNGVIPAAGWPIQNLSNPVGVTSWSQTNSLVFPPQSGAGFASANFNNTSGVGTISNWMFAPNITFKNGDKFSFYTRTTTGTFPDRLQLRMSSNGASVNVGANESSVGDFTTLLLDINPNLTSTGYPTAWTQFNVTMSGLPAAGISGRLAFRYFVTSGGPAGANSDFIGIDNAVYTSFTSIDPTTCTGSTANLKVDITGGSSPTYKVVIGATPATPGYPITVTGYVSGSNIPVTPSVTTTYNLVSVVAEDNCTCVGTGNSGTPTITVSPTTIAPITINASPNGPLCAGSPTLLSVAQAPSTPAFSSAVPVLISFGPLTGTAAGPASPYPSTLTVSGLPTSGVTVTSVSLANISHTWASDLDILLQSPSGQNVILFSDFGGSNDFVNTNLTFSDAGATMTSSNPMPSGTFKCVNTAGPDNFVAPGPGSITNINPTLATFTGDFNGAWKLFVVDQAGGDTGRIAGGYTIRFNVPGGTLPSTYTYNWTPASGLSSTTGNPVAASPMSTTTYTVMATAPGGCQTTAAITININQLPAVVTPPANKTVCANSSTTFNVVASGAGITYQWQVSTNGGVSYSNVTNAAPYSGVTTSTLTITNIPASFNNYRFRVVISGTCPPAATSAAGVLTVNDLPVIVITPGTPVCGGIAGVNGTLLTAGSAAPPIPGTTTFNSGAINIPIPEGVFPAPPATAASNAIAVSGIPANATITNISVTSNITHPYVGDVVMVLKAPNGAVFNLDALLNRTNNPGADFVNTVISASGTTLLSAGTAPFTSTFKADAVGATFSAFGFTLAGGPTGFAPTTSNWFDLYPNPNGNWTIAAYDAGAPDVGNLTSWSIKIDYTTPGGAGSPLTYTWSPATGLYSNATATVPYIAGTVTNQVYAAPAVNTVYTVTGTNGTTGCVNTGTVGVTYTPKAPVVNPAAPSMCLGDAAIPLTITSSLAPSPFTTTYSSGAISVPIVDNSPAGSTSTINVPLPATAQITNMTVAVNMSHTWAGDVAIALKAPNNNILNLDYFISGSGGTGATSGFTNTRFSSSATAAISTGANPYNGVFKADAASATANPAGGPTGFIPNVTAFSQLYSTPNGNWTLGIYDAFPGDAGTLTSWSLTFDYLFGPPAPGIWTPNGIGSGLFTDAAGLNVYTGTSVNTVYAKPSATTTYSVTVASIGPDSVKTFTNPAPITINDGAPASPYPATITVSGLPATGAKVQSVTITGLSHTWSDDIDILLQSPTGTNVVLMSDVGSLNGLTNVTYTFNDAAPGTMSTTAANPSGTYKPTNNGATDTWPAPGPGAVTDASPALANFAGNPNGGWKLFIVDDVFGDQGSISGGYNITFSYPTAGCTSAATTVPVTVNIPVSITAQPVNAAVCTDKVTSFTVTVTGTGPTYQWQISIDNGNTFTNVSNGGVYAGATTATLTITAPPVSMSGYLYRAVIKGRAPCGSVTSTQRLLTVNPLPTVVISVSPYQKLFPGLTTTLFSTVTPAAATYTWLRNGTAVANATGSSLIVNVDGLGDYRLRVTDVNGCSNTSNLISITDSITGKVFIYPNPNSGQFQVRYYSIINNTGLPRGINIYDARGKRVSTQVYSISSPYARMDVDLRNHGTGVYWVEVVDANGNRLAMGRTQVLR